MMFGLENWVNYAILGRSSKLENNSIDYMWKIFLGDFREATYIEKERKT